MELEERLALIAQQVTEKRTLCPVCKQPKNGKNITRVYCSRKCTDHARYLRKKEEAKAKPVEKRFCECGADITHRNGRAERCEPCSYKRTLEKKRIARANYRRANPEKIKEYERNRPPRSKEQIERRNEMVKEINRKRYAMDAEYRERRRQDRLKWKERNKERLEKERLARAKWSNLAGSSYCSIRADVKESYRKILANLND